MREYLKFGGQIRDSRNLGVKNLNFKNLNLDHSGSYTWLRYFFPSSLSLSSFSLSLSLQIAATLFAPLSARPPAIALVTLNLPLSAYLSFSLTQAFSLPFFLAFFFTLFDIKRPSHDQDHQQLNGVHALGKWGQTTPRWLDSG